MEYEPYDSSGTDDDLPALNQNQSMSARNPRTQIPNQRKNIHGLERDAYTAVLRAFKAQGDSITWDKENLITDLRRELSVSDEEHRELLTIVNSDDVSVRPTGGPATSASRKRHLPAPPPIPVLSGSKSKRPKPDSSNLFVVNGVMENPTSLIGRKVRIRWPKDNIFYEAVIKEYDPHKGTHALVYYIGTAKEAWEWIDLKEIAVKDIRWDEDESGLTGRKTSHGPGPGRSRSGGPGPGGPGVSRNALPPQNGGAKKLLDNIQVPDTETIIKEVEKVLNNPDIFEIEKAKKLLKEHEQSLLDAIARLAEASDCESEEGNGEHHLGRNGRSFNY